MSGMTFSLNESKNEFLGQTINLAQELLADIINDINSLPKLTPELELYWIKQLTQMTIDIQQFVEITTLTSKLISTQKKQSLPQVKESHIHLLFIIKAINQARIKSDLIALEELIKYELKDNLTMWKIDLISQIKRLLAT